MTVSAARKWSTIVGVAFATLLGMSVWFSVSAVAPALQQELELAPAQVAWLTMAVQLGFVVGAVASALRNLADRTPPQVLMAGGCLAGAVATVAATLCEPSLPLLLLLRFVTGAACALVYPVGMRLVASWTQRDRGLGIGVVVLATTVGSAAPQLLRAVGATDAWRPPLFGATALAIVGALLALVFARCGPFASPTPPFQLRQMAQAWRHRPLRLANLGYLGHMWELYAMWTWLAVFLSASFEAAGVRHHGTLAELVTFAAIGAGALGAWAGGVCADRWGRTTVTIIAMAASGTCAAGIGWLYGAAPWLVSLVALVWGVTVIADSAQFSASVAELSDAASVGTMLTLQTCVGFLVTLVSIQLVAPVVAALGWTAAFTLLALGPLLGCVAMARLRACADAAHLAGGRR